MSVREYYSLFQVKLLWLINGADLIGREGQQNRLAVRFLSMDSELARLEEAYQKILTLVDSSKSADTEILTSSRAEYMRALDAYDRLKIAEMEQRALDPVNEAVDTKQGIVRAESDNLLSRLPTLQLPRFSGEMDQWVGFNNLFDSLVDSRTDLSSAQKLAYLMTCLSGEARGLVQHIKISDAGYGIARGLLMKRYQNTRRLADVHVDQILKLPLITPRLNGLRNQFINPLVMSINSLERLGFQVTEWSFLLLHICLNKLPTTLKTRFEQRYGGESDTIPKFTDLLDFLETECRLLENATAETVSSSTRGVEQSQQGRLVKRFTQYAAVAAADSCCSYCKDSGHAIVNCGRFKALHPHDRKDFVTESRLCFHCLGGHGYRDCDRVPRCGCGSQRHHSLLCFNKPGTYGANNSPKSHSASPSRRQLRMGGDNHRGYNSGQHTPDNQDRTSNIGSNRNRGVRDGARVRSPRADSPRGGSSQRQAVAYQAVGSANTPSNYNRQ